MGYYLSVLVARIIWVRERNIFATTASDWNSHPASRRKFGFGELLSRGLLVCGMALWRRRCGRAHPLQPDRGTDSRTILEAGWYVLILVIILNYAIS